MSDAPLVLRDVRRTYRTEAGELPVLRGVDLTLQAGEIVALVAPSGAGQVHAAASRRVVGRPDGGSVFIEGCDAGNTAGRGAHRHPPRHHRLRLPIPSFAGEFTALENVVLPQMIAGSIAPRC